MSETRKHWRRNGIAVAVIGTVIVCPFLKARADHEDVLAEARAELTEYFSTIRSIVVRLETEVDSKNGPCTNIVEWGQSPRGKYQRSQLLFSDPKHGSRDADWISEFGGNSYSVRFWLKPELPPRDIRIREGQPIDDRFHGGVPGFHMAGSHSDTLADLINRPEAKIIKREEVDGVMCWHCDLGAFGEVGSPPHQILVWLDPTIGFLIRRIGTVPTRLIHGADRETYLSGKAINLRVGEVITWYRVTQYQKVDDPIFGSRWFPERKIFSTFDTQPFVFTNVEINQSIPDSQFVPKGAVGTLLMRWPRTGDAHSEYVGGEVGAARYRELERELDPREHHPNDNASVAPIVDASRSPKSSLPFWFATCAVLLMSAATIHQLRSMHQRRLKA